MPDSETLDIIIRGRDEFGRVLEGVGKGLNRTQRAAQATGRAMRRLRRGMGGLRRSLFGLRTAIAGLGLGLLARQFINASNEQQKAIEGLNASLRAMGRFSPELSKSLQQVATELQGVTNFGDESVIAGQKFLATYRNISDEVLPRASKAMLDFAALTGGDVVQAANALGKASLGLTGELRRTGVIIEANTFKTKGFVGVLAEIESQVGGQAAAQRKATGSMVAFGNVVGDTGEFIGDLLKLSLEPLLQTLVEEFGNLNEKIQKLKDEGQLHIWAEQWAGVIIKLLGWIGKAIGLVADSFWGWKLLWQTLKIAFASFAEFLNFALSLVYKTAAKGWKFLGDLIIKVADLIDKIDFTGKFKGMTDQIRKAGGVLKNVGSFVQGMSDGLEDGARYWLNIQEESKETLKNLIAQGAPSKKIGEFFDRIIKKAEEYKGKIKEMEAAQVSLQKKPPVPEASFAQQTKSILLRSRETTQTIIAEQDAMFKAGEISAAKFYDKKAELLKADFDLTKKTLEAQAELAGLRDPTEELKLRDQIFKIEQKFTRDVIALAEERAAAEDKITEARREAEDVLAGIRERAADPQSLQQQFANEAQALAAKQAQELEGLKEFLQAKTITETEFNEAKNNQVLEQDKLLNDQRQRLNESYVQSLRATFGTLEQAFGDLYEGTGKKIKAFFILQKAAGVANTLIATYESAQQVYKSASQIPFVGQYLAPVAAGVAIAAGLARVSMIRAQSLAKGGAVDGYSPTTTSDNVPIMATAGEFMHPVDTVRHYGVRAMEAIRNRMVPKELFAGYGVSPPKPNYGYAFQAGGRVPPGATPPKAGGGRDVVIANFYDPEELTRFLATSRGQDAVVNAIAGRRETVRRVIQ